MKLPEFDLSNKINAKLDEFQGQLDQLAKLPKPVRQAMAPAIGLLVLAAYLYLFLFPANAELEGLRGQAKAKQIELSKAESVAENLPAFEKQLKNLEAELKVALRQLPDSKEIPGLLTDISTLGKNAGLDIKKFKPNDEIPRGFYAEVPLEIAFTGTFHQVVTFFDLVAKLPRIVNVGELLIEIEKENAEETTLKVTGKATTFRFIDQEPTQAEPAKAAPGKRSKGEVG
jgi:type IV pilus assembly protein PilO